MKKFTFLWILISLAVFSNTMFGQITSVGCTMDSITAYSSAIGYQTIASGKYSLASGYKVKALANQSYIFGTKQTGNASAQPPTIDANNTKQEMKRIL